MIVDAFTQVAAAHALTATGVSTSSIDMSADDPDWGVGEPVGFAINIDVAMDLANADETYQVNIVDDDDVALGSPVVIAEQIILRGEGVLGAQFFIDLPPNRTLQRYLGLQWVLAGTTPSLTYSAHFGPRSMSEVPYRSYPKGYTIS